MTAPSLLPDLETVHQHFGAEIADIVFLDLVGEEDYLYLDEIAKEVLRRAAERADRRLVEIGINADPEAVTNAIKRGFGARIRVLRIGCDAYRGGRA